MLNLPYNLALRVLRVYVPTTAKYEYEGLLETLKRFVVDMKQTEDEDLTAYRKHFKQANDIFKQAVGKGWLDNFVQHTQESTDATDTNEQAELMKNGPEPLATFVFLKNSE